MKLTQEENDICDYYSKQKIDDVIIVNGQEIKVVKTGCGHCPLLINKRIHLCKANANKRDIEIYGEPNGNKS